MVSYPSVTGLRRATRESEPARYQIRYRCTRDDGTTALIVVGEDAAPYLFSDGGLLARLRPHQRCERLVGLLARCGHWAPVPPVAPYTLDELRALVGPQVRRRPRRQPHARGWARAMRRPSRCERCA